MTADQNNVAAGTPKMVGDLKAQWPVNFSNDNPMATSTPQVASKTAVGKKADEQKPIERPPSSVSRQFMPNKQKNASEMWSKHEEKLQDKKENNNFGYTPFKTGPVNGGARAPQKMDVTALTVDGFSKPRYEPNGAMSQTHGSTMNRSNSALGQPMVTRPNSRAASELNFNPVPSRYQSYCTLPRPEQIEHVDPAAQIYGYGQPRPVPVSMAAAYGLNPAMSVAYGSNGGHLRHQWSH
ncbi:hypothetical protein L596_021458 [Steinernema carpocapsae]|uniref:Uncharacterized protein n=1 Tax=Steinernema carpocapsae TaxID=34508 RepID=A0A4U5MIU5_STECR|nr:hypothetical protein L596_021458 [Steinernema carpocapsae]